MVRPCSLTFIILLDDLKRRSAVHKFVDDTTITEILPETLTVNQLPSWKTVYSVWLIGPELTRC